MMFHVKHELWGELAQSLGRRLSPEQDTLLHRYTRWLLEEAIPAGAVGPDESHRLHDRHIADSLLFLHGWKRDLDPGQIWDLGSGAGLPGIPLAILLPETEVTLIDRSGRRIDLLKRVMRLLDLSNIVIQRRDIESLTGAASMIVSRATLGPERAGLLMKRHVAPDGVAVLGGSWLGRPRVISPDWEVEEIHLDSLDRSVWLLIMRA